MKLKVNDNLAEIEKRFLKKIPKSRTISSYKLIRSVEKGTDYNRDTVRYAYWNLISKGNLIRVPEGVKKG